MEKKNNRIAASLLLVGVLDIIYDAEEVELNSFPIPHSNLFLANRLSI